MKLGTKTVSAAKVVNKRVYIRDSPKAPREVSGADAQIIGVAVLVSVRARLRS